MIFKFKDLQRTVRVRANPVKVGKRKVNFTSSEWVSNPRCPALKVSNGTALLERFQLRQVHVTGRVKSGETRASKSRWIFFLLLIG